MNRQIIIYVLIVIITFFLICSHPIAAQNQIFPIGKLGYANVTSIAWNSDADLLAVANGLTIDLIDTVSYKRLALLTGYTQEISSVAFSPDDRWLASGSDDHTVKIWDTNNWQEIASLTGHIDRRGRSLAFSPDGHLLATGGYDGVILLWNMTPYTPIKADINNDGSVSIFDLVLVATHFGSRLGNANYNAAADPNGDGVIDVSDLLLVAQSIGVGAAPPIYTSENLSLLINLYAMIEEIPYPDGGIELVKDLLKRLIREYSPSQTKLLHNYPNPFNPETWIPYQLASDSRVSITIYDVSGRRVRLLDLGIQPKGSYVTKDKAAYWDGKNDAGESVSSGIYIYQMNAGTYRLTKKMVIYK